MTHLNRRQLLAHSTAVIGAGLGVFSALPAIAQTWPTTTKIIVPLPPGGPVDALVRRLGELLAPKLASAVVVENKPGASGVIAAKAAASGAADGSSVFYLHSGLLTVQAVTGRLNLLSDFKLVTKLTTGPHVLAVPAKSPYKTQAELIAAIKANPGKLNYGTGGNGSPTHLAFEWLDEKVPGGLKATQIPFKGATEALVAMVGGDVDFGFQQPAAVVEHVKSGKLRVLSSTGVVRTPLLPSVPTVAEAGVPGYVFDSWGSLAVPIKTPDAVVSKLEAAIKAAVATPEFAAIIGRIGGVVDVSASPAALTEQVRAALVAEKTLVTRLGITAE